MGAAFEPPPLRSLSLASDGADLPHPRRPPRRASTRDRAAPVRRLVRPAGDRCRPRRARRGRDVGDDFAGSAQFAAASILDSGGGAVAAIVAAVLLNARYVPLSLAVASIFHGSRRRRAVESQLIVDESWALAGRTGRFEYGVLIGAGLLLYVVWVGGTALGTVIGDLLDPEAIGVDAAFPALFLALLAPYLRDRRALLTAIVAGAITLVLIPVSPPGVPIVAASLAALIGLRR